MRGCGRRTHGLLALWLPCLWLPLAAVAEPDLLALGHAAAARGAFGEAAAHYAAAVDARSESAGAELREALVALAEAQQAQGDYGAALTSLGRALPLAQVQGDAAAVALLRGARGSLYIALASPAQAREELEAALAIARRVGAAGVAAVVLHNLGNAHAAAGDLTAALRAYRDAAAGTDRALDPMLAVRAHANAARALVELGQAAPALAQLGSATEALSQQPPDHEKAMLLVHLARSYEGVRTLARPPASEGSAEPAPSELLRRAHALLTQAEEIAAQQGDLWAGSYAQGYLGALYAAQGRGAEALELTRRALYRAEQVGAGEMRLRWQAQAARIQVGLGARDEALAEYARAVELLEELRHRLATRYGRQASFEDVVGPIHLEYVDLLLQRAAASADPEPDLERAQRTLESLKAAELRDYFRDECVDNTLESRVGAAQVSPSAAIVYPVLLEDRLELLVSTREGISRSSVAVGRAQVTEEVRRFRFLLEKRTTRQFLGPARRLHSWLIEPLAGRLADPALDTLVFVPDGPLRTIPMAALHDGGRFLIERYAVAITPGLELTDPRPLDRQGARVFTGGLTEAVQGFAPLPFVADELAHIQELYESDALVDDAFVDSRVESALASQPYSVVHLASHATFGERGDDSFILTHDGRISLDELASYVGLFRFRDRPLDLLMLSACATAAGDDRSALGLSGIAVKAGARSAVGTLWPVNDEASSLLVQDFYAALREPDQSRAQALRRAQLGQLAKRRHRHPAYWAAFVLISNWL